MQQRPAQVSRRRAGDKNTGVAIILYSSGVTRPATRENDTPINSSCAAVKKTATTTFYHDTAALTRRPPLHPLLHSPSCFSSVQSTKRPGNLDASHQVE